MEELKQYLESQLEYYQQFEDTQGEAQVIEDVLNKIESINK